MQVGAENRTKLIAAVVLLALAVVFLARWLFGSGGAASSAAATPPPADSAIVAAPHGRRTSPAAKKVSAVQRSLDPSLRYDWLKVSEDTKYEGKGRNIFRAQIDIPQPKAPAVTDKLPPAPPPGPPPPPPIPLKFFGFASKPGEPKRIFLSQGEDVFIAGEGEIVDRRYRILRISPMSVEVEDVLTNNRQSIPLTQG